MDVDTKPVVQKLTNYHESPLEFDELVLAWNRLCEQSLESGDDEYQFADIEHAAILALSDSSPIVRSEQIGNDISRLLSNFDYPTCLVTRDGRIAAMNTVASQELELNIGDGVDLLPFHFEGSKKISSVVAERIRVCSESDSNALLKRAYGKTTDREATIGITVSLGRVPMALVFVITTHWKSSALQLLRKEFQLTDAESDILVSFIDGFSSQDIAINRARSHATVRTQFQSLLAKTGARNQTELLRIALSVSQFDNKLGIIADTINHPYRRRADVLRPGGRSVELTLMGDVNGKPVLTLANASNYTFNAKVEKALYDAGLYLISVCTPGCGHTGLNNRNETRLRCIANDIEAILNQLGIEHCALLAYNANSPLCFALANTIPNRFFHVVQVAACPPTRFTRSRQTVSPWVSGILRAGIDHPSMKKILFVGAMKAWVTLGARQFMRLQMTSDSVDAKHALLDENIREYEKALKLATHGGVSAAASDMAMTFEDWTPEIEKLPMKISIAHGVLDKLVIIESAREMAKAFSEKIKLYEIDKGGFALLQSHTAEVIALLLTTINTYEQDKT